MHANIELYPATLEHKRAYLRLIPPEYQELVAMLEGIKVLGVSSVTLTHCEKLQEHYQTLHVVCVVPTPDVPRTFLDVLQLHLNHTIPHSLLPFVKISVYTPAYYEDACLDFLVRERVFGKKSICLYSSERGNRNYF